MQLDDLSIYATTTAVCQLSKIADAQLEADCSGLTANPGQKRAMPYHIESNRMILSVCLDTQVHHLCHNDGCCQLSKLLMPNSRLIAPRRVSQRRRSRRRAPYYDPRPPRVAWTARIGTPNRCPSARPSWPVPARRRSRRRATYYAPRPPVWHDGG